MNQKLILGGIGVLAVVVFSIGYVYTTSRNQTATVTNMTPTATTATPTSKQPTPPTAVASTTRLTATDQLFAHDPAYHQAHEIYPATTTDLSSILSGFTFTKTDLGQGRTSIRLATASSEYQPQQVTVTAGEQVYFVERFAGDDTGDADHGLRDDYLVVVDATGHIMR